MRNRRHFQRQGRGVFVCCTCGRQTRIVDQDLNSECCPECYELAGIDNAVNDSGGTVLGEYAAERDALLAAIVRKGGNAERVKADYGYLWPVVPYPGIVD